MKRFDYDLVVIGSGDAGSEAALIAAKSGLNVALVEAKKWGGSNLNTSNVPFGAALNGALTESPHTEQSPSLLWEHSSIRRRKACFCFLL